jgi:flagellar M-ring protein FliF
MRDKVPAPMRRILATFGSFTAGQKAVTLLGVIALVIGGYFFATWASQPTYSPLFSNLSGTDASAIVDQLAAEGTPYQLSDGGATILVPQDQVYDMRLKMSGQGLPAQADTGYALLDKQGVTTSDFMQQVGYQRALEGELAKTIKSIDGVRTATVHLVIPKKDIFSDDEKKPSASILVASQLGKELDHGQVQSIVHLVASSVEGLEPDQVTVAGADGTMLSTGDGQSLAAGGDLRAQQTSQFEKRMNSALQRMLDSVVGPGHAVVKTTADLDFDQTETKTQRYTADDNVPPLNETTTKETYTGGNNNAGGVLGPDNIAVPGGADGDGNYESTSETRNNAVGLVTETRKSAPGNVRRLNVSVLLDANAAKGIDTAQVQQMISSAVGLDAQRGDSMAVTALPFDMSAAKQAEKALAEADAAAKQNEMFSMGKTGAIVLVVLILLFMAWRASRKARRSRLTERELAQLDEMRLALDKQQETRAAIEGSGAPALPAATEPEVDMLALEREARHREITQMVEKQPDEVAQLLRGWLADRRS